MASVTQRRSPRAAVAARRKYRILRVITQSEAEAGGSHHHAFHLAQGLDPERYETTVACGKGGELIGRLQEAGLDVIAMRHLVRRVSPLHDLVAFFQLYRLIRHGRYDIVATHSSKAGFLGRLAAKCARTPLTLFTAHGFAFNEPGPWWKQRLWTAVEFLGAAASDCVITVSDYDRESALRRGILPTSKVRTIHNGVDTRKFTPWPEKPLSRADLAIPADRQVVGTVANFYPAKGLPILLEAVALLQRETPRVLALVVGEGPLRGLLERQIVRLGLQDHVKLLGYRSDIPALLPLLDVFALSSVKEGCPWAILEAMAAGRAIVASAVGGVTELIEDGKNGLLVPPFDPPALARALKRLLSDPEMARQMGQAARERVCARFSLEEMIQKTERLYDELISRCALLSREAKGKRREMGWEGVRT